MSLSLASLRPHDALSVSDNTGESTIFIEFMLNITNEALRDTISESKPSSPDYAKRTEIALQKLNDWFDRGKYMNICKGISSATASRDLKQLLDENRIESTGTGRMTRYRKING